MGIFSDNTIEDIVRLHVPFTYGISKGWNKTYCAVCGDGSRTKGPRGGWLFEGDACFYHCFNCGVDANFDPNREIPFSKYMRNVLDKFGVPSTDYNLIAYSKKLQHNTFKKVYTKNTINEKIIDIPDHFYKLSDAQVDNVIAINAKEYLYSRHVDPDSYPFYLSTGICHSDDPNEILMAKSLRNRIIIPSFKGNLMVYYQARALDKDSKIPYINCNVPRGNIIYGFDQLFTNIDAPLFITEGFFDKYHLNGICVLENNLTSTQIDIIERSPRKKIVVPDRRKKKDDSIKLAQQAIELGWGISIPDIGKCKDIAEAINKYGKLYVLDSVMKNIKEGASAKAFLQFI